MWKFIRREKVVRVRVKLDEFENQVFRIRNFCRCHRAFLCNLYYAEQIDRDRIWMTNGVQIPISRSRQREVNECMISYLLRLIQIIFGLLFFRQDLVGAATGTIKRTFAKSGIWMILYLCLFSLSTRLFYDTNLQLIVFNCKQ